jgi:neutral ceramidase
MAKPARIFPIGLLLLLACVSPLKVPAMGVEWMAGVAAVDITPSGPIWMAGYAARKSPSQGTAQPLHAKALALEDSRAHRCIIITTDLLGFPSSVSEPIAERIRQRFGL